MSTVLDLRNPDLQLRSANRSSSADQFLDYKMPNPEKKTVNPIGSGVRFIPELAKYGSFTFQNPDTYLANVNVAHLGLGTICERLGCQAQFCVWE